MCKKILFFEKSPFMGVELFSLLKNDYYLFSYYNDGNFRNLKKLGYPMETYNNKNLTESIDSDKAVVCLLSDRDFVQRIIKAKYSHPMALFFFMSRDMDRALKKIRMEMALPPYEIQEEIGSKIGLNNICSRLDIPVNESITIEKSKRKIQEAFHTCWKLLGLPFIIQGNLGVSGEDTFKIDSYKEFSRHWKKLGDKFKASRYIKNNIPLSVHICITKHKSYYEGPFLQLIGFKELALNPYQFSGNDTNQTLITDSIKKKIYELSMKLTTYAKTKGYSGILGIDFLWDKTNNKVIVQEINSRLVGLTRLLTGIQKEQNIFPHLINHINNFFPFYKNNALKNRKIDVSKHSYSQLYIAHNNEKDLKIKKYLLPGIYKAVNSRLKRTKNSLCISDMATDEVLINFSAYKGTRLHTDQIFSKIILKKSVLLNGKYELNKNILNIIQVIKKEIS